MSRAFIWTLLIACIMVIALAIVISNAGLGPQAFAFLKYVPGGDKTGHFVGMGVLSLLANLALNGGPIDRSPRRFQIVTLACLVVVTLEECSQLFIASRSFGFGDLAADVAGIIGGGWLAWIWLVNRKTDNANPNQ